VCCRLVMFAAHSSGVSGAVSVINDNIPKCRCYKVQQQQGNSEPSAIASSVPERLPRIWNYIFTDLSQKGSVIVHTVLALRLPAGRFFFKK